MAEGPPFPRGHGNRAAEEILPLEFAFHRRRSRDGAAMTIFDRNTLWLYGTVGKYNDDLDFFTAIYVRDELAKAGSAPITVRLNSPGGDADQGVVIYNLLKEHPGKVTVVVDAVAASAGSIIAMAGDDVIMATGSEMMVHDPWNVAVGNERDLQKTIDSLRTTTEGMLDIYVRKTGRKREAIRAEMEAETWMTAQQAVAKRYADRVSAERSTEPMAFDYSAYRHTPDRIAAFGLRKKASVSWDSVVSEVNRRLGLSAADVEKTAKQARADSWDSVVADVNRRLGVSALDVEKTTNKRVNFW
jgi:ATP-dependent protease ClpP protease subunit